MVPTGTPPMNPYPECSHYGTFLLKVQAEMVPIWNFHKQTPGTLPTECFLYISKAKIGLTRNFTANSSHKPFPVCSLWDVSIQVENMPTWSYSHKPMPSMLSAGCFSYTSRLKWCLQDLVQQTSAQYVLYGMFLLHIHAEMVPTGTSPTNQCPVCYLQAVSLTHPG